MKSNLFIRKLVNLLLLMCITTVVASSCKKEEKPDFKIETFTLSPENLSLSIGETAVIDVLITPEDAIKNIEVEWYSSDESIATVRDGKVTALAEGNAEITATIQEFSATCYVTVESDTPNNGENEINGHQYVDLGLTSGLLWATKNVGAENPEEAGDWYAWGEIETKSEYTRENSLTLGDEIGDISSDPLYDVAADKWGDSWRIPTSYEYMELLDECVFVWTDEDGIIGYNVTGPNGNSIFFPAAGFYANSDVIDRGYQGNYWTSTPSSETNAYEFYLDSENPSIIFSEKFYGQNVRPVSGEITHVTGIEPVQKSISMNVSDKLLLEYNIYPESLRDLANVTLHSEDESVVQVSGLYLTAVGEGECRVQIKCNGLTDYCDVTVVDDTEPLSIALNVTELSLDPGESFQLEATISPASAAEGAVINWSTTNDVQGYVDDNGLVTAFLWDSRAPALIIAEYNGVYATCKVGISSNYSNFTNLTVDLGLSSGVEWGTVNVGATTPFESGDYFAWGETETKSQFTQENCSTFSKNIGDIGLNPKYDAASFQNGTDTYWRMPSDNEYKELIDYCTWTWINMSETGGYKVTGPNGYSIFLPAVGYVDNTSNKYQGDKGIYWTSSPSNTTVNAAVLSFDNPEEGNTNITSNAHFSRYLGAPVRGVIDYDPMITDIGFSRIKAKVMRKTNTYQIPVEIIPSESSHKALVWESSDISVATVDEQGKVTAVNPGTATITATWPKAKVSETFIISVVSGAHQNNYFVDLGLPSGTRWAAFNIGSSDLTDEGNYYAWGETSTKSSYTEGNSVNYGREMPLDIGEDNNRSISGNSTYDAARNEWGGSWRIPTKDECKELIDNCQKERILYVDESDKIWLVYKLTGPNGNSIFLPQTGQMESGALTQQNSSILWTSTTEYYEEYYSYQLYIGLNPDSPDGTNSYVSQDYRYIGKSIRPVYTP